MKKVLWIIMLVLCVSLVSAKICYQESANVSNQSGTDNCIETLYTGGYGESGTWGDTSIVDPDDWRDGDYNTNTYGDPSAVGYINYTVPPFTNSAIWQIRRGQLAGGGNDITENFTVSENCLIQKPLQFRIQSGTGAIGYTNWSCYNGSSWENYSYTSSGPPTSAHRVSEEGVYWNISDAPVINITAPSDDNTSQYPSSFNLNVTIGNSTTLNYTNLTIYNPDNSTLFTRRKNVSSSTSPYTLLNVSNEVYYSFDRANLSSDDALDLSGNSNTGVNGGATIVNATGKINDSFDFIASATSYVQTPAATNVLAESGTISLWFNGDDFNTGRRVFDERDASKASLRVISANTLTFSMFDSNSEEEIQTGTLNTGQWYHIVGRWNTTHFQVFVDNSQIGSDSFDGFLSTARNQGVNIGARRDNQLADVNGHFNGKIDEVSIWSRALTDQEIGLLYNSGNGINFYNNLPNVTTNTTNLTQINYTELINMSQNGTHLMTVQAFDSFGNQVNQSVTYLYQGGNVSTSEQYDANVIGDLAHTYYLNITWNTLLWDNITSVALEYNGQNYSVTTISNTIVAGLTNLTQYSSIVNNLTVSSNNGTRSHKWYYTLNNNTVSVSSNTTPATQTEWKIHVDECGASAFINETVANFTFYDEINSTQLTNVSYNFNTGAGDGTNNYTQLFNNTDTDNATLCTNLPPSIFDYTWDLVGDITLQNDGYAPRVYSFDIGGGLTIGNNPYYNYSLYLIPLGNSTTVTFTWLTLQYQVLDGTMIVNRCNIDGSQSLVASVPIVGGFANVNLELFTALYSYQILYNGVLYTNSQGWSRCHTEASEDLTYYIDVIEEDPKPVIGLWYTFCNIEKSGTDTVTMSFGPSVDNTNITGCIQGYIDSIYTKTLIYENCTDYVGPGIEQFQRTITNTGASYYVTGYVLDNDINRAGLCLDTVSFYVRDDERDLFRLEAIFAVVLLIMAMALLYAGDGPVMMGSVVVGLVGSFILGILIVDIITVMTIISIILVLTFIARGNRR